MHRHNGMPKLLVLNGPNLNLLGQREPSIYGQATLEDLERLCEDWGHEFGAMVVCKQSNYEGQLLEWIHDAHEHSAHNATGGNPDSMRGMHGDGVQGLILNAGALTHYSYALRDAIAAQPLPTVEVHISNIYARESFRHTSVLAPVCKGSISGLGFLGYRLAIEYLLSDE